MDTSKHNGFFDPLTMIDCDIHIIGCGAVGSTVAEMLTRMGVQKLHLYDFDTVSAHNLANQMFINAAINDPKTLALKIICTAINPEITITEHTEGWLPDTKLSGYVFLCVDNIDLRRQICEENQYNPYIKAMFDFRMRLTDAQHYAADWSNPESIQQLLNTMQFSHDEAKEATPTNACGTTMNIISTVRSIVSFGLANFINFIKTRELKKMILVDAFSFIVDAF
jgi:hypothetical protein